MRIEQQFEHLENRALSALRNVNPNTGSIHDYRNILRPVDKAMRAINNAYIALQRAESELAEIAARQ